MNTNQTIDGVPRDLLQKITDGGYCHQGLMDRLRALLDAKPAETLAGHHPACRAVDDYKPGECSHSCKPATQPQGEPVEVVLPEFEPAFEKWWEEDGQYCRAGGGSYEKTFAYRAYEAALADVTRLNTK